MKLIVILFFLSNSALGQFTLDQSQPNKYSAGLFGNLFYYGIYSGLEGGLHLEKHSFNLGLGINPYRVPVPSIKNSCLNFNYNYFPNGHKNRFDLLFDFNMILGSINYNSGADFIQDVNLGFGFNTNLSQRFFIKTTLGTGIVMRRFQFSDVNWSSNFRLSLGYRF